MNHVHPAHSGAAAARLSTGRFIAALVAVIGLACSGNGIAASVEWTTIAASRDSRTIYVSSSSGRDGNSGTSPEKPRATIAGGAALLRPGYPDRLLFKKGDTWTNQSLSCENIRGRSATEPMLISSYGTGPRPLFKQNSHFLMVHGGCGKGDRGEFLAIIGLELHAYQRDPASPDFDATKATSSFVGISTLSPFTYLLVEDVKFSYFSTCMNASAMLNPDNSSNLVFRRNVCLNSYLDNRSGHSQGVFFASIDNLLIEDNVFHQCGWNAELQALGYKTHPTVFNHCMYLKDNQARLSPSVVRNNIVMRGASNGVQQRMGGTLYNNLFVRNAIAYFSASLPSTQTYNVTLEGTDITSHPSGISQGGEYDQTRGWGGEIDGHTGSGSVARYNIIANRLTKNANQAFYLLAEYGSISGCNVTNNIFYNWGKNALNQRAMAPHKISCTTSPNEVGLTGYSSPARSVATYNASLGGAPTFAGFVAAVSQQSKDNWNPALTANAVNNYIRAGFDKSAWNQ